jgi:hypothetical protein
MDRSALVEKIWLKGFFPPLLVAVFALYFVNTQLYVGACDWYGYYRESQLMQQGSVSFTAEYPISQFPCQVPMGYIAVGDRALPQYPPGYPLLLALFGFVGLEFYVTPMVGVLSCVFVFLIARDLTKPWIAALFTLIWAVCPIVAFGAMAVMSDLVATTCVLGAYYFYRRKWLFVSALFFGLGVAVRPTNVLLLPALAIPLWRDRQLIRYVLLLAIPAAVYGYYNYRVFGAPWTTGYSDFSSDLLAETFVPHLIGYTQKTLVQFSPLLLLLALGTLLKPNAEKLCWAAGLAIFFVFYSFWRHGDATWWWSRFLLPAYPGLLMLAACGLHEFLLSAERSPAAWKSGVRIVLLVLVALLPAYLFSYGYTKNTWKRKKALDYYKVTRAVEKIVPEGSYVGSVEFAGAIQVYSEKVKPFVTVITTSDTFADQLLRSGRPVYLIIETWNRENELVKKMFDRYDHPQIATIQVWGGLPVYQLKLKE